MIELEIQALAASREGLLIEMSRSILTAGFTLRRQRLVPDAHGILLTVVVRGPSRGRRALEKLLDASDRLVSFKIAPVVDGELKPHFAASLPRSMRGPAAPADSTAIEPVAVAASGERNLDQPTAVAASVAADVPQSPPAEPDPEIEFIQPIARQPVAAALSPIAAQPFVEVVRAGPDEAAVAKALSSLEYDYPRLLPQLLTLQAAVPEAARESSLELAGRRTGGWVFAREYALDNDLDLLDAISRIGAPALRALVEVDQHDALLHILNSPLCVVDGQSGCSFFRGFLEGLLGPAIAPRGLSIFPVCCCSYGAQECVLAISD